MTETVERAPVEMGLAHLIGQDINRSIENLGYPVGLGMGVHPDIAERAGYAIIDRLTIKALTDLLAVRGAAAPAARGAWQPIETFTLSGHNNPVIVAVPTSEGGWIVGEAWRRDEDYMICDNGWWWAGTGPGDYHSDLIRNSNHGDPIWYQPLPEAPDAILALGGQHSGNTGELNKGGGNGE